MRTHIVEPGDWVTLGPEGGFRHCGDATITAFLQRQPMPSAPAEHRNEHLQVRPGDVVCVVAPGMTVFVKGVEPAKITVPEFEQELKSPERVWIDTIVKTWLEGAANVRRNLQLEWPEMGNLLYELEETFP